VNAEPTELAGVVIVRAPVHGDERGFFTEVFRQSRFQSLGLPSTFAQDNHSRSAKGVLRGLHLQLSNPQGKLVRPTHGSIFDVAVDVRRSSTTYGQWIGVQLDAGDGRQLWIPAGFAHGFLVLSDVADVTYKCTTEYDSASSRTIRWDDPEIGIQWPLPAGSAPTLSVVDGDAPSLSSQLWFE
jgi:dTDP-4-dehydrorhamnose 3,5-epimerase